MFHQTAQLKPLKSLKEGWANLWTEGYLLHVFINTPPYFLPCHTGR